MGPAANTPEIVKGRKMRYFALFLMLASLTLFSVGCTKTDEPAPDPSPAATVDTPAETDAPEPPAGEPAAEGSAEKEKPAEGEAK